MQYTNQMDTLSHDIRLFQDSAAKSAVKWAMLCAELHFQQSESAESQYVCSQCKGRLRIWVYKGKIQLVLATVPDSQFGHGSGSKPNGSQIGGPGSQ